MIAHNKQPEPEDEKLPEKNGGFGGGTDYPLAHKNELAKLEGRALKWNIKPEYREAILKRQLKDAINPSSTPRDANRAAKFVLEADKLDTSIENAIYSNHQQFTAVNVHNHNHVTTQQNGVEIVYDGNWYGNEDRLPPATS